MQLVAKMKPVKRTSFKKKVVFLILFVYCTIDLFELLFKPTNWHIINELDLRLADCSAKDFHSVGLNPPITHKDSRKLHWTGDDATSGVVDNLGRSDLKCGNIRSIIEREYTRGFKLFQLVEGIRLLRLEAPKSIQAGQAIILRCLAETRRDKLQSLSWYKNGREFYRYEPFNQKQSVLIFNTTGINVDTLKSRNNTVVLTNTTSETSGRYKCEVTGVSFQEAHMETYINVLVPNSGVMSHLSINCILLFWLTIITIISNHCIS